MFVKNNWRSFFINIFGETLIMQEEPFCIFKQKKTLKPAFFVSQYKISAYWK